MDRFRSRSARVQVAIFHTVVGHARFLPVLPIHLSTLRCRT
ncbi:hypothetical protein ARTSIC4J27_2846 [Pseudarthrobacter siccitolerans]|uniref:Uncharacterized protein n=1 Tax=Pseudarthrobacter siccitolerans TaxID=861266 RepID=A0A024H3X4_9MICC|nr:hypothetical protein ARTSIC4J27_2846 [Pseudarthrobacter siccitolerans]